MKKIIGPALDPRFESLVPVYFLNGGLGLAAASNRKLKDITPYLKYFPVPTGEDEEYNKGEYIRTGRVLQLIDSKVKKYFTDTTRFAKEVIASGLNPESPAYKRQVGQRLYQWLFNHIQYKQDRAGREELRRPARAVKEAKSGVDCDCYTYFISTVLKNLGIHHCLRIIACGNATAYHHIYVVIPQVWGKQCEPYRDNSQYIVVDPVLDTFNAEPRDIKAYHDYPMTASIALSGLGYTAMDDLLQKMKDTRRMMAENPASYIAAGINPTQAVSMLTEAINAWNTPSRAAVLDRLRRREAAMYTGLNGVPVNGLFQNIANTVKQAANSVVNTVKTAVTDPTKFINDTIDRSKEIIDKVIDAGRTGGLYIPRKAYMGLLQLNVRGMAGKLKKGLDNPQVYNRLKQIWEGDIGGDMPNLVKSINIGAEKPFLFGLGALYGEPVTIAALLASAGAVIGMIQPIMKMIEDVSNTVSSAGKAIESGKAVVNLFQPDKTNTTASPANPSVPSVPFAPSQPFIITPPGGTTIDPLSNTTTVTQPAEVEMPPASSYVTSQAKEGSSNILLWLLGGGLLAAAAYKGLSGGGKPKEKTTALNGLKRKAKAYTKTAQTKANVKF